jgi:hypothetical protein
MQMEESTLNRVLFRSRHPWIEAHRVPPDVPQSPAPRAAWDSNAPAETLQDWSGTYRSADLDQT